MGTGSYEESQMSAWSTTFNVGSGIFTTATTSSLATYSGADDINDSNIRGIYTLADDFWALKGQFSRLIETLKERRIIP
jgi:hypothetical protein